MLRDPDDPTSEETPEERRALDEALKKVPPLDLEKLERAFARAEEEARAMAEAAKHQTIIISPIRYRA